MRENNVEGELRDGRAESRRRWIAWGGKYGWRERFPWEVDEEGEELAQEIGMIRGLTGMIDVTTAEQDVLVGN